MMEQKLSQILFSIIKKINIRKLILTTAFIAFVMNPAFAVTKKHAAKPVKVEKTTAHQKSTKPTKPEKTAKSAKPTKLEKSIPAKPVKTASAAKTKTKQISSLTKTKSHIKAEAKKTTLTKTKVASKKSTKPSKQKIAAKKSKQNLRHPVTQTAELHQRAKVNTTNISQSHIPSYLLTSIEKNLVNFVRKTVETIRYTAYKLGGNKIDKSRGIYVVDCSSYVDHILRTVYPRAFTSLSSWSGTEKPTTDDFYHYFTNLSDDSTHWNTIEDVEKLRPGDILVFRNKNRYGNETGGHVMVVMDKPRREGNTFLLRIADSAPSGHTKDTRIPHTSGIGIGTMLLKVNPKTFQPYAYAWKVGSRWETNVNFAMARPIGIG